MLVDLRPKNAHRQARPRRRSSAPTSPATRTPFRSIPKSPPSPRASASARPAGTSRGFGEAEFKRDRRADRRSARRPAQANGDDNNGAVEAAGRATRSRRSPPASRSTASKVYAMRCPYCGNDDTQVKDSRPTEDSRHPPPPHLPRLRRSLHHLRARAAARTDRGQEVRPQGAVRPRQAGALGQHRAAQARRRARPRRTHDLGHRAPARKPGRESKSPPTRSANSSWRGSRASTTSPSSASPRSTRTSRPPSGALFQGFRRAGGFDRTPSRQPV